jgi:cytochrome P450
VYQKTSKRIANSLREPPQKGAEKSSGEDLLGDLIRLHKQRPDFKEIYLRRLAVTNFGAGHETMCSALTAAMAMIGTHAEVLRKVVDEVRDTARPAPYDDASTQFPYTQASIKEAQRLYPVIGMSLSRKVPRTGLILDGRFFPPGTTVGCNPVALHMNVDLFGDDADEYRPARWLQEDKYDMVRAMERINLTWGGGMRTCPGRHLAELVLHKVVPALIKEFDLEITSLPGDSEMPCYFMAMMTGVKARFLPVRKLTAA